MEVEFQIISPEKCLNLKAFELLNFCCDTIEDLLKTCF